MVHSCIPDTTMSTAICAASAATRIQIGVAVGAGEPGSVNTSAGPVTTQTLAMETNCRAGVMRPVSTPGTHPARYPSAVTSGTIAGGSTYSAGTVASTMGEGWPASVTKRVRDANATTTTTIPASTHVNVRSQGRNAAIALATAMNTAQEMGSVQRSSGDSGDAPRFRLPASNSSCR